LTHRSTLYQKGMIFVGGGANGKSTLQEIVKALFPVRTVTAIAPQDFEQEYRRAQLAHSRINMVSELPEADILGAEAVKAMITGDLMTGREIRRSPFSFTPKAAHLFSANTLPSVRDMTRGFWRRWLLLDFSREFTEDEQDHRLASRIIAGEMAAVASWALQGAATLAARGHYDIPQSSHETLAEWKMVADQVAAFLEDRCITADHTERGDYTPLSRIYNHYRTWADSNGHNALSIRKFGRRLSGLGVSRKRQSAGMAYALSVGPILKAVN
jgi:putative DNA primase/helicase